MAWPVRLSRAQMRIVQIVTSITLLAILWHAMDGAEALRTCTFGCVYCPTEVDEEGEQLAQETRVLLDTHSPRHEC